MSQLEGVVITLDEFEVFRLAYVEGYAQGKIAKQMRIHQTTVSRILASAQKKIADALVNVKALRVEKGCCQIRKRKKMNPIKKFLFIVVLFLGCFYLPVENFRFTNAVSEALALVKWYAREHVLLCLVPAFFIAGAISVFVSQASVMKYFCAKANKFLSYSVASVSGTILALCS